MKNIFGGDGGMVVVLLTKSLSMLQFPVESLLSVRQLIHFFILFNSTLCKTLIERAAIHCAKTFCYDGTILFYLNAVRYILH